MLKLVLPEYRYLESVKTAIGEYKKTPSPFNICCVQHLINAAENNFQTYFSDVEDAKMPSICPQTMFRQQLCGFWIMITT